MPRTSFTPRRWLQFRLRTLLVGMTVFTLWFGWQWNIVSSRRALAKRLDDPGNTWAFRLFPYTGESTGTNWWFYEVHDFDRDLGDLMPVSSIPFWRRWMGDVPMLMIYIPESAQKEDIDEAARLFPEATLYMPRTGGGEVRPPAKLRSIFSFE